MTVRGKDIPVRGTKPLPKTPLRYGSAAGMQPCGPSALP